MPCKIRKVKGGYRVSTPSGVKSKKTTKAKAKRQCRLINATEHGFVANRDALRKRVMS